MSVKTKIEINKTSRSPEVTKIGEGRYKYKSGEPFEFSNSLTISCLELVYETYGELNKDKSNVILIHHSLSVGANVNEWWSDFLGPEKVIDTKKYFIICINNLGSCFGSSGPSLNTINTDTNKPYLSNFPQFNFNDIVKSQLMLLEHLEIPKIHAVIGSSMGGMISLSLLLKRPDMVSNIFLCATSYKSYPFNVANRMVQRDVIEQSDEFKNGCYKSNPEKALKLARKIGLLFYRGIPELNQRFSINENTIENIHSYYEHNATKFSKIFDANSYIYTLNCMDNYNLDFNIIDYNEITNVTIIGINSDILFPIYQQQELYNEMKKKFKNIKFLEHSTPYGHDSFFIETDNYSKYLHDFLR